MSGASNWPTIRLKRIAELRYGESLSAESREDGPYSVYGSNGVVGCHSRANMGSPGIVVGRKGSFGKIVRAEGGGFVIDTAYYIDRHCTQADIGWLVYALTTLGLDEFSQDTGVPGLSREMAYNKRLRLPPRSVQRQIAQFLDEKTAAIDALIDEQQGLVDRLAEKRAALINRAVTRGLDPDVQMKDSGVPWIGEIPAHWEIRRLKYLVDEAVAGPYGSSLTKAMYTESGYRVYGQQQVIPDDFSVGDYYISNEKFAEMRRYEVHPGDVLVSVMGTVGRVAVVPSGVEPGIINPRLVRYRPTSALVRSRFMQLAMLARCSQEFLALHAQGATMDGLNMGTLGELSLPVPPMSVQQHIVEWVKRKVTELDELRESIEREIDLLQEYRQSLITAAVTGQLALS